jgi:putative membrane-bound dehydrogenase-like protein
MRILLVTITLAMAPALARGQAGMDSQPLGPAESLKAIQTRPGFRVELMAAEPLVQSPIAFSFGPDGKLWVVEMGDYPSGADGKGKPGGRIKFLEDTGTGHLDRATLVLDGLAYPTAVLPWRRGALAISAPDILYMEYTGPGRAAKVDVLFTGLARGNPQHLANGLVYGLDNWVYCANGDSGGEVVSKKTGKKVNIRGRDFRIKPDTGEIELQSGQTQFGRNRDDWGNWFGNNNSQPFWHYVLDDHYLARNPLVAAPDSRVIVPTVPGVAPVYPVAPILPRFNDPYAAGRFTSACSPIVYRDSLFGPAFAGNSFVSEPVHNLIHREVVEPRGFSFTSKRADDEQYSEFLASADTWFRPTTIQTGPDGGLWIADMYRHVIEHPQWIPKEWQQKLDLRAGADKGRLYRVLPTGVQPRSIPRFDKLGPAELAALLESPNGPVRDMAQMVMAQRGDYKAVVHLEKSFRDSKKPLARLHALCALDGLSELHVDYLQIALSDEHPAVRRHALRLLEPHLAEGYYPNLRFHELDQDEDPQVRLQLACSLGEWRERENARRLLANLVLRDGSSPHLVAAAFSSLRKADFADFARYVVGTSGKEPTALVLEKLVQLGAGFGDDEGMAALLHAIGAAVEGEASSRLAAIARYLDALDDREQSLAAVQGRPSASLKAAVRGLDGLFRTARRLAVDPKAKMELRQMAISLLGRGLSERDEDRKILAGLLAPQSAAELQAAAAVELTKLAEPQALEVLLGGWRGYGPALRGQILDALISRAATLSSVLDAIEKKTIPAANVDAARRQVLMNHKSEAVRKRAAGLFAALTDVDRQKVIDSYRPALALKGSPERGAEVFKKNCSACHRLGEIGQAVGPDLAVEAAKTGEALLISILDPNRAVEPRYISYTATTKNGRILNGLLASETGSSITLIAADGNRHDIARDDLDELSSSGKSLMPEGLEKELSHSALADLVAYIRGSASQRKKFDGNNPALVKADADGGLALVVAHGEIFGRTLMFEKKERKVSQWTSEDDRVTWTIELPRSGNYAVWLDWSCAPAAAGNTFALGSGESVLLRARVAPTEGWESFRYSKVGEIRLPAGQTRLTLQAAGQIRGSLLDLKEIKLVPAK